MPRSRRRPKNAEATDDTAQTRRKKKNAAGYEPQFGNPDFEQRQTKGARLDMVLHQFALRYRNLQESEKLLATRYITECVDICVALLPVRFCVVINHFHNLFTGMKELRRLTFDQYLYDVVQHNHCHGAQQLIFAPNERDLCSERHYEEPQPDNALLPRRRRPTQRLFTPQQRDGVMLVLNRVLLACLLDPLMVAGALQGTEEAVQWGKLAAALFFFCDETLVFRATDGCSANKIVLPGDLVAASAARLLPDLERFEREPALGNATNDKKRHKKKKKEREKEREQELTDEQRSITKGAVLDETLFRSLLRRFMDKMEELQVDTDLPAERLVDCLAALLMHTLKTVDTSMYELRTDFVTAMTLFMTRKLHPLWSEALRFEHDFVEHPMDVVYFVQVNLRELPNLVFMWNKRGLDTSVAHIINYVVLYVLDVQLNILLIVAGLAMKVLRQTTLNLPLMLYLLQFVMSLSSNSSPDSLKSVFNILATTDDE